MAPTGKNRIMIFGPKDDGTYVVEFRTAAGEALAISIPRGETAVIRHLQERMPYALFVPEVPSEQLTIRAVSARNVVPLVIEENSRGADAACRSGL
jgi:hypothetical protein